MRFIIRFVVRDDDFSSKAIKVIEIRRPVLELFLNHEKPVPRGISKADMDKYLDRLMKLSIQTYEGNLLGGQSDEVSSII